MLRIHAFSGITPEQVLNRVGGSEKYLDQYSFFESGGWKTTRFQGIIAAYLACNPDMTASALAAFAYHNGAPLDFDINLDTDDQQAPRTIGGTIYFLDDYPNLSGFQQYFADWAAGYEVATLPPLPAQYVAPEPEYEYEQAQPLAPQPTNYVPSQPAPQPVRPATQPAPAAVQPAATQPLAPAQPATMPQPVPTGPAPAAMPQPVPASTVKPSAQTPGAVAKKDDNTMMYLLIAAAVVVVFLMMSKKGKRR